MEDTCTLEGAIIFTAAPKDPIVLSRFEAGRLFTELSCILLFKLRADTSSLKGLLLP